MIGFFDSGVGGLTIIEEVHKLLPKYKTIYLGDTARAPYGEKTHQQLVEYTWQGVEWLFAQGCTLIIVACNTASSSALREIQQTKLKKYPNKRILGVIRPTVEKLSQQGYKNILVLSTQATKDSRAYPKEFKKENPDINVISHSCPNWGSLVEAGKAGTPEMQQEVVREIKEAEKISVDYEAVLLACTHYPYVRQDVEFALTKKVPVFNQGELVAQSLADYLNRHQEIEVKLEKDFQYSYFTTGDEYIAELVASKRFGYEVKFQHVDLKLG